jgi:small subunit ribosomal protein S6
MNGKYETVYILRADLTEEGTKKIHDKVNEVVARRGGKVVQHQDLGTKMLAYRIARQNKGRYFQLNFDGGGQVVDDLEKNLRLTEEVLRFLSVRFEEAPSTGGVV